MPTPFLVTFGAEPTTGLLKSRRWFEPQWLFLVLLVGVGYLVPLTATPLVGEETRRATCASEMLRTGDFIVHRQQNTVYLSRPPLGSWAIAAVGWLRGGVDEVATRLPSALATLGTTLLVYWYARQFASPLAALAAGCVYATFGQVLEIGRLGESEAPFTLLVAASLLVWHVGYVRNWPAAATWVAGYSLAALGALIKGPQAPLYFVAAVTVYLLVRRQARRLASVPHGAGVLAFLLLIGCWQIPYLMEQGWRNTWLTWFGLAIEKATDHSLPRHLVKFPFELFACLLPWSVWLPALATRRVRQALKPLRPCTEFLAVCLLVTFPTVWFASAARARYFMPLYPCIAVLVGLAIDRCALAAGDSKLFAHWRRFALGGAVLAGGAALGVLLVAVVPWSVWESLRPTPTIAVTLIAAAAVAAGSFAASVRSPGHTQCELAVASAAGLIALIYVGLLTPAQASELRNGHQAVAPAKAYLPEGARLISLDPVHHWFVYHLGQPVAMTPWPRSSEDLPEDVEYFCFDWHEGDTPERRRTEFGQLRWHTSGTLPFAWEEVARVPCDRKLDRKPSAAVIIGRVLRDHPAAAMADRPIASRVR